MNFEGKVALVTGAARGIGKVIAQTLAQKGAAVVVTDIELEGIQALAQALENEGHQVQAIQADVAQRAEVKRLVSETVSVFGKVDILVNNAGIIRRGTFVEHDLQEWGKVLEVNLGGTFNCSQEVAPLMIKQGSGKIINISSIAGKVGDLASAPSYGASKGGINALTFALARELAPHGINVNAIAPHAIETDMSREWPEEKRRRIIESIPLKRLGTPQEIAEAVSFLASDGANFITGEILDVNGGFLMD